MYIVALLYFVMYSNATAELYSKMYSFVMTLVIKIGPFRYMLKQTVRFSVLIISIPDD